MRSPALRGRESNSNKHTQELRLQAASREQSPFKSMVLGRFSPVFAIYPNFWAWGPGPGSPWAEEAPPGSLALLEEASGPNGPMTVSQGHLDLAWMPIRARGEV